MKKAAGKRLHGRRPGNFGSQTSEPSCDLLAEGHSSGFNPPQLNCPTMSRIRPLVQIGAPPPNDEAQHAQPPEASANRKPDGQVKRRPAIRKAGGGGNNLQGDFVAEAQGKTVRIEAGRKDEGESAMKKNMKHVQKTSEKLKTGGGNLGQREAPKDERQRGTITRKDFEKKMKELFKRRGEED